MCPSWGPMAFSLAIGSIVQPNYLMLWWFLEGVSSFWNVKITFMTIIWVHARPFTTSVPYSHLYMVWGGSLMERFGGLVQGLVIYEYLNTCTMYFAEVDARMRGVTGPKKFNTDAEWQGISTTEEGDYQMTTLVYLRYLYAHERSYVLVWKIIIKTKRYRNKLIFHKSRRTSRGRAAYM